MNKIIKSITSGMLLCTMLVYTTPVLAYTKEETVYSKIDSDGKNYKTLVTDHLSGEEDLINDLTDLLNIENINGEEEFTKEGNKIIWRSNGEDIYYKGETDKELPVECSIKYELNGQEMSKDEISGKSGKVKITIQYTNKEEHIVRISGRNTTLYTPFIVGCGIILPNDNNKNIELSNGKIVNDGSKTIVAGIVVPGLQESLGLSKDVIDIPDTMEISMETTNFKMGTIIAYITPKLLEEEDLEIFDKLDEIYAQVDTLQNASKQIEEGANTLAEGTNEYNEKSKEFNSAMKQIADGINSATESYSKIDSGIDSLNKNAGTLSSGAKSVSDGTKAIFSGIQTIDENLAKLEIGSKSLEVGENQISAGLDKVISSVNGIDVSDNTEKIQSLQQLNNANENTVNNLKTTNTTLENMIASTTDEATIENLKTQIATNKQLIGLLEKNIEAQNENINTLKQTDANKIKELQQGLTELKQGMTNLQAGTKNLSNGITELKQGTELLSSKTGELVSGTETLYNGTVQLSAGTKTLRSGSTEMKTGMNAINSSSKQITEANSKLTEGALTIAEGAQNLSDGVVEFNRDGINKICNYINNNIKDVTNRLEKLEELSKEYSSFTMKDEEVKGNVQFIMVLDDKKDE